MLLNCGVGEDQFDLLAVQGTLKSLLQYHGSKASIFGAPKSLQMVIAAMKLKDVYSLEVKL